MNKELDSNTVKMMSAAIKIFDDLPNEILLEVFSYLSLEDLAFSAQDVCVRWRDVCQDHKLWKNKDFCPSLQLNENEIIDHFQKMPALRSYRASNVIPNRVIKSLCRYCKNIQKIDFHPAQVIKASILGEIVRTYPNIKSLALSLPFENRMEQLEIMKIIGNCRELTSLTLKGRVGETFKLILFPIVIGCPKLQHFHLLYDNNIDDANILPLLEGKKHHLLSFSQRLYISREVSEKLSECTKLQYLDIVNDVSEDVSHLAIEPLMKLRTLKHFGLRNSSEKLVDFLPNFFLSGSFSQLVNLDLSDTYFMNDTLVNAVCKNCPHLKRLLLSGSQILQNEGLKFIGCCKQLEYLDVSMSMDLTDGGMEYVGAGCNNLQCLDISGCYKMTDRVIEHIVKCKQLRVLKFNYNDLTGSYFHLISSHLPRLLELHVESGKYLSRMFVDELHKKMPNLKIVIARKYKDPYNIPISDHVTLFLESDYLKVSHCNEQHIDPYYIVV
ncbi:hypothetical protein C0J52_13307 [Blattella germanica]|nr:hypothetical protein C0J52_13307 [Blattella germanica]